MAPNYMDILRVLCVVAMALHVRCCHVMPEKLDGRNTLCEGPQLVLPDVGICGTHSPTYTEELSFKIYFPWAERMKTYILIMLDPDAPMKEYPILADYVHWLIADIPGPDLLAGVVSGLTAKELIPYKNPSPPPGSGYHRYQLFLFESSEDTTAKDLVGYMPASRAKFDFANFVIANNLCYLLRATFQFSHEEPKYAMNRPVRFA